MCYLVVAISDFGIKDKNSVAIRDNESFKKKFIYINGIPFKVHNIAAKKKTNFLDSLGLSSLQEDGGFYPTGNSTQVVSQ